MKEKSKGRNEKNKNQAKAQTIKRYRWNGEKAHNRQTQREDKESNKNGDQNFNLSNNDRAGYERELHIKLELN